MNNVLVKTRTKKVRNTYIKILLLLYLTILFTAPSEMLAAIEVLDIGGASRVAEVIKYHPGWSAHEAGGGSLSIIQSDLVPNGRTFKVDIPYSESAAFLRFTLAKPVEEIWVAFSIRILNARPDCNWARPFALVGDDEKNQLEMRLRESKLVELASQPQSSTYTRTHLTGYPWWPGQKYRYIIGFRKGDEGFVKFYVENAKIYCLDGVDMGEGMISRVEIGGFSTIGVNLGGSLEIGDIRISTNSEDLITQIQPTINITDKVLSTVNFDCFGINTSHPGIDWPAKAFDLERTLKFNTYRYGYRCTEKDWDGEMTWQANPNRNYWYASEGVGNAKSFLCSSFYTACTKDPLFICILNCMGERNSKWDAEHAVEWVRFNNNYRKPDGTVGLRAIYEAGNEVSLPQSLTEGWWYDGKSYIQIGSGEALWDARHAKEVYPLENGLPDCLSNEKMNFKLDFGPGKYLYLGFRWKFNEIIYELANLPKEETAGSIRLNYEYWDEITQQWRNFNQWVNGWETDKHPHFLATGQLNRVTFDWRRLEGWGKRSIRDEAGENNSSISDDRLYYIRLSLYSRGTLFAEAPIEKFIRVCMPGESYIEILKHFAPVRKAGGILYAWIGMVGNKGFEKALAENTDLYDGIVSHFYTSYDCEPNKSNGPLHIMINAGLWMPELVSKYGEYLRNKFPGKKIGLTEWDFSGVHPSLLTCHINGLRAAITQCEILKGGWDFAAYHTGFFPYKLGYSYMTNSSTNPRLRPTGLGIKLVRDCALKYVLDAQSNHPWLYVCAFRGETEKDINLVVVNRADSNLTATINLPIEGCSFRIKDFTGSPYENNEESYEIRFRYHSSIYAGRSFAYTFPAYSVTAFEAKI
ncbi:MAG: hypothetical protein K6T99_10240 [Armatimonadetes bacterium]|nr:hypothetical protein [Armatimonadota bacterium]